MAIIRKPSQEDDISAAEDAVPTDSADESVIEPMMELEGNEKVPPAEVKQPGTQIDSKTNATIARAFTGATPALMGMLFGASPLMAEDQIIQGQKFYAGGVPKKMVLTKGPNGQPVYTDVREAAGEDAWTKPTAVRPPSAAGLKQQTYINRETNEPVFTTLDPRTGVSKVNTTGEVITLDKYKPAVETTSPIQYEGLKGEKAIAERNKYIPGMQKGAQLAEGLGERYKLPKHEVELGEKYAEKTAVEMKPYIEGRANIKAALEMIQRDPKSDNAVVQAAGIFRTAKLIVNERISDQERGFVTQAPGMLDDLANRIATGVTGAQRESILSQMRQILTHLDKVQEDSARVVQDTNVLAYSGGEKNKAKYLQDRIVNAASAQNVPTAPAKAPKVIQVAPKYTRQQLDAMSPQQRDRIKREIMARKGAL
jgi:hypothetical protein